MRRHVSSFTNLNGIWTLVGARLSVASFPYSKASEPHPLRSDRRYASGVAEDHAACGLEGRCEGHCFAPFTCQFIERGITPRAILSRNSEVVAI